MEVILFVAIMCAATRESVCIERKSWFWYRENFDKIAFNFKRISHADFIKNYERDVQKRIVRLEKREMQAVQKR